MQPTIKLRSVPEPALRLEPAPSELLKIYQRGVQWKQGVVVYMMLYTTLLYNTTPIHCTPLRLHPPLMNTQQSAEGARGGARERPWRFGEHSLYMW